MEGTNSKITMFAHFQEYHIRVYMVLEDAVTKEHFNGYPVALFVQAHFRPRVRGFFLFCVSSAQFCTQAR